MSYWMHLLKLLKIAALLDKAISRLCAGSSYLHLGTGLHAILFGCGMQGRYATASVLWKGMLLRQKNLERSRILLTVVAHFTR